MAGDDDDTKKEIAASVQAVTFEIEGERAEK